MSRSFYCHQCAANVEINLTEWTCVQCSSGFIEELRSQPRRNPAVNRAPQQATQRGHQAQRMGIDLLQQMLNPLQPPSQSSNRETPRQPSIRIHNDPTRVQVDSNRRNPSRSSLFVSADGNLLPGRDGDGLHGMVHGPFQGFHGLIDTILSSLQAGTVGGGFNPGDYVWGQNGLDDILTQLLQQVEGGAPAASRDDLQRLNPEPFKQSMKENNSQCSVCLCDFEIDEEVIQLPNCKHIFHPPCVLRWLELHDSCPICRTPLRGQSTTTQSSGPTTSSNNPFTRRSQSTSTTTAPIPSASSTIHPNPNNWQDIIEEEDLD